MPVDPSKIGYWGGCPECGDNGYVNIGRSHWIICEFHRVKWFIGENLFSSWHDETEEDWKRNAALIEDFKEVEPVFLDDKTGKVITSAELDAITAARRQQEFPTAASPDSVDEIGLVVAEAALLAECETLAAAGVMLVAAHFDGWGDEGTTEKVRCHDYEQKPMEYDASRLQEHFEALVRCGFEIDRGGFGDVVLDVQGRKITVKRDDRSEGSESTTDEI